MAKSGYVHLNNSLLGGYNPSTNPKPKGPAAPATPQPPPMAPQAGPIAAPPSVLTPAPTTPPSGIPPSLAGLGAAGSTGDALNGPTSGPLRQDLGTRQPPSLAALLQGLRY